jgi:hypothetical protein
VYTEAVIRNEDAAGDGLRVMTFSCPRTGVTEETLMATAGSETGTVLIRYYSCMMFPFNLVNADCIIQAIAVVTGLRAVPPKSHGSDPGRGKNLSLLQNDEPILGPYKPPNQLFPRGKWLGLQADYQSSCSDEVKNVRSVPPFSHMAS